MFWTFVVRALEYRKQRLLLAFSALAVASTLATVLFGIYGTVEQRFREEFRSYGANIAAVPVSGKTVPLEIAAAAERQGAEAAPFLITSGRIATLSVPVAGFMPAKSTQMTSYWHMQGSRNIGPGDCVAGELLATRLQLRLGATVALEGSPCTLKGIVATGEAEDQELLVPFDTAARLAGVNDAASLIEIRAPGGREEAVRAALAKEFPAADIKTNLAVAGTESNVVFEIRASLFLLTLLILIITTLCVSSNFTEMVIERSKEIGILKAIGAAERKIAAFFVSESAVLALSATLAGYVIGVFAAAAIGREVFGGVFRLEPSLAVLGGVTGVMLAVAGIATAIAASRIWSIQPAVILRGE
ncbi:MAG TPA: FtsX-like permease family protein [Bryobacteraceae bacterium]|nr:FtsX-like permease family protein [Bryobacteraceae bacterium]